MHIYLIFYVFQNNLPRLSKKLNLKGIFYHLFIVDPFEAVVDAFVVLIDRDVFGRILQRIEVSEMQFSIKLGRIWLLDICLLWPSVAL